MSVSSKFLVLRTRLAEAASRATHGFDVCIRVAQLVSSCVRSIGNLVLSHDRWVGGNLEFRVCGKVSDAAHTA